jgi:hypothetical protein
MNYLTKYYKNLSEQLQEKINVLQTQLQEMSGYPTPSEMAKEMMAGTRVTKTQRPYPTPSEMAAEMMAGTRDMTANRHDGPDPDTTATADEVEISQKAKQLGEATMSKATRLGKKYPGTVARATAAQTRRLPKKQEHRDDLRREAESEAALEYAAGAKGSEYASGADAENWWRESRGEDPRYGVGKANERVQDVIGNLAKLSILKFFDYRKAKKKKK